LTGNDRINNQKELLFLCFFVQINAAMDMCELFSLRQLHDSLTV